MSGGSFESVPQASTGPTPSNGGETRSLGEIIGDVTSDLSDLMRQELELAKVELKDEMTNAGKGVGMLGGAAIGAHMLLVFVSLALMFLLDDVLPLSLSALITALVWGAIAAALALAGRTQLKKTNPTLPKTQRTLQEDATWATAQKN